MELAFLEKEGAGDLVEVWVFEVFGVLCFDV